MWGLRWFTTKPLGYLVEPQNQDQRLGWQRRDPGGREASMPADVWRNRRACAGRTRSVATAWPCDEEECYMTYFPLRGLYHNLSAWGSMVICLAREGLIYISSRVSRQTSIRTASHFPCSIGLDFSSVCKESTSK
jgi:hypothetical protein